MFDILIASTLLYGHISNLDGRIGVRAHHDMISHVYRYSPGYEIGLEVGDKILLSDGHKGTSHMTGPCGSVICLKVLRKGERYTYYVERRPWAEVRD